ncbi:MAG: site-specific integrase [Candidatus Komeilibacteria bacterium]
MTYSLNQLINAFLEHWEYVRKRRPETARNYELYLRRFQIFSQITSAKKISDSLVQRYSKYLQATSFNGKKLSSSTINYHLIALRNFIKYLKLHSINITLDKKIKLSDYRPTHRITPTKIELRSLLTAPAKSQRDPEIIRLRDQAILACMIDSKLKVSDVVRLEKTDFRGSGLKIMTHAGSQTLSLGESTKKLLRQYLAFRHDNNPHLFVSHDRAEKSRSKKNRPLTTRSIQRLVLKYIQLASIARNLTTDSLRY